MTAPKDSLEGYLERWLKDVAPLSCRPITLESYESKLRNHVYPKTGTSKTDRFTADAIEWAVRGHAAEGHVPAHDPIRAGHSSQGPGGRRNPERTSLQRSCTRLGRPL